MYAVLYWQCFKILCLSLQMRVLSNFILLIFIILCFFKLFKNYVCVCVCGGVPSFRSVHHVCEVSILASRGRQIPGEWACKGLCC